MVCLGDILTRVEHMPLTPDEQRFIDEVKARRYHAGGDEVQRLLNIIERLTPPVFSVGDRVIAVDHKGERLGRGRVVASQRYEGKYMKVKLDGGIEVTVPQAMAKRLVKK
jgi:hypothetical protein